jgi:hypothetical protein
VQVPQGWKTQPQGDQGISVINEESRASVTVGVMHGPEASTPSPQTELDDVQSQFGKNCPHANIKQRGSSTLGGLTGMFLIVSCAESDGEDLLRFVAASWPGMVLLLNSSVPAASAARLQSVMKSIENSVALGNGSTDQSKAVAEIFNQDSEAPDFPRQLAALMKACDLGTLSKDECAQKMASLKAPPRFPAT